VPVRKFCGPRRGQTAGGRYCGRLGVGHRSLKRAWLAIRAGRNCAILGWPEVVVQTSCQPASAGRFDSRRHLAPRTPAPHQGRSHDHRACTRSEGSTGAGKSPDRQGPFVRRGRPAASLVARRGHRHGDEEQRPPPPWPRRPRAGGGPASRSRRPGARPPTPPAKPDRNQARRRHRRRDRRAAPSVSKNSKVPAETGGRR